MVHVTQAGNVHSLDTKHLSVETQAHALALAWRTTAHSYPSVEKPRATTRSGLHTQQHNTHFTHYNYTGSASAVALQKPIFSKSDCT